SSVPAAGLFDAGIDASLDPTLSSRFGFMMGSIVSPALSFVVLELELADLDGRSVLGPRSSQRLVDADVRKELLKVAHARIAFEVEPPHQPFEVAALDDEPFLVPLDAEIPE